MSQTSEAVTQDIADWDNATWPERLLASNTLLNLYLSGIIEPEEPWTKKEVDQFVEWMDANCQITTSPMILYRGTTIPSPVVEYSPPDESPMEGTRRLLRRFMRGTVTKSVNYLSTSTDVNIAKEFTGVPRDYEDRLDENGDIEEYDGAAEFDENNTPGFVHVLFLSTGCRIFDMDAHYSRIQLDREKEIIILPKHRFVPCDIKDKYMSWKVEPQI
jgi:hypothetical protein